MLKPQLFDVYRANFAVRGIILKNFLTFSYALYVTRWRSLSLLLSSKQTVRAVMASHW